MKDTSSSLLGQEMIYEVAMAIEDYISDHNGLILHSKSVSAYSLMQDQWDIAEKSKVQQSQDRIQEMQKQDRENYVNMQKLVEAEISAKKALLETQSLVASSSNSLPPIFASFPESRLPFFRTTIDNVNYASFTRKVLKNDVNSIKSTFELLYTFRHANLAELKSFTTFEKDNQTYIQVAFLDNCSVVLNDILKVAGSIQLYRSQNILLELLTILDDVSSIGIKDLLISASNVWFRDNGSLESCYFLFDSVVGGDIF